VRQVQQSRIQWGPGVGLLCVAALLAVLDLTGGIGLVGSVTGLVSGVVGCALLARGLTRRGAARMGPADGVTLARLVLSCGIAALAVDSFFQVARVPALVVLAGVALMLDWLDGFVARRTRSASELGARFDMETDAFLILVLSLYVADATGWWVLVIGLARYAFVGAGAVWPWLRSTVPPRYWCKVVAAAQGVVLTVAASDLLPAAVETLTLGVALVLLAESFGREVWQLWSLQAVELAVRAREPVALVAVASGPADG
jgi:phosphatidylglycerophosphate synthase